MSSKRIYEVAKELGKPVHEVIELLKKNNINKSNLNVADDSVMAVIHKAYDKKPEPPKPAKAEKRDVKPTAPAKEQPKQNDNKKFSNNGQRNMQQNHQNQRNNNGQQGRPENRQGNNNNGGLPASDDRHCGSDGFP